MGNAPEAPRSHCVLICPYFRQRLYKSGPKESDPGKCGRCTWDPTGMYLVMGTSVSRRGTGVGSLLSWVLVMPKRFFTIGPVPRIRDRISQASIPGHARSDCVQVATLSSAGSCREPQESRSQEAISSASYPCHSLTISSGRLTGSRLWDETVTSARLHITSHPSPAWMRPASSKHIQVHHGQHVVVPSVDRSQSLSRQIPDTPRPSSPNY